MWLFFISKFGGFLKEIFLFLFLFSQFDKILHETIVAMAYVHTYYLMKL